MGEFSKINIFTMSGKFVLYTRKMIKNPLLARKQCQVEMIHPDEPNVSKTAIKQKLADILETNTISRLTSEETRCGTPRRPRPESNSRTSKEESTNLEVPLKQRLPIQTKKRRSDLLAEDIHCFHSPGKS